VILPLPETKESPANVKVAPIFIWIIEFRVEPPEFASINVH
jgi:hypothetical protein